MDPTYPNTKQLLKTHFHLWLRSNFDSTPPPILIDAGVAILENEKIERHIMKAIPGGHNLFVADVEVAKRIENLYNKFKVGWFRFYIPS